MQAELRTFFEAIQLPAKYYAAFHDVYIEKPVYDRSTNRLHLSLTTSAPIDIEAYLAFLDALKQHESVQVDPTFTITQEATINELAVHAYYYAFLERHLKTAPLYDFLVQTKLIFQNKKIFLPLSSPSQQQSLTPIVAELEQAFRCAGFSYPWEVKMLELGDDEVVHLIKSEKEKLIEEGRKLIQAAPLSSKEFKPTRKREELQQVTIATLDPEDQNVIIEGRVFDVSIFDRQGRGSAIYSIYLTDDQDSVMLKIREGRRFTKEFLDKITINTYLRATGSMTYDAYARDQVFDARVLEIIPSPNEREDRALNKRVELHLHTKLSAMDGVSTIESYVEQALKWGHPAIALTDHGVIQAFPEAQAAVKGKPIKMIYGMEAYVVDDLVEAALQPQPVELNNAIFVSFDLETTGLSGRHDAIIEFGAVKIKDGIQFDSFQTFINPRRRLSPTITRLTNITDEMLVSAPTIEEMLGKIRAFLGDAILVAHNAAFDVRFLNEAFKAHNLPPLTNPIIDTVVLARYLYSMKSYSLGGVCRYLNIAYDEDDAHRADYDARILGEAFLMILNDVVTKHRCLTHDAINQLRPLDYYKQARPIHAILLVQNATGLKNLYKLVSISHLEYITHIPLIPRRILSEHREGLIVGSACFNGELFDIAHTGTKQELMDATSFYDYVEIQPLANYSYLLDTDRLDGKDRLVRILHDMMEAAEACGKPVVATGDAHYVAPRDKIYRDVYIMAKAKDARAHPLYDFRKRVKANPDQHFRSTDEMLDAMRELFDEERVQRMVITAPAAIAATIDVVEPIKDRLYTPSLPNIDAQQEIEDMCHHEAKRRYGNPLPELVAKRLEKELTSIRDNKFGVIYYLAHRLVKKSREDGYLVGSRGSVGSSLVATLAGITEVNPLPPHYLCRQCQHVEFFLDGDVASGYDLPDHACPVCGSLMSGEGQNIPFETFLGINGDKVPDIDLNFSREYQAQAHNYTKVLLGENNVFRAGTISTVAEKTAYGYARNYFEETGRDQYREAEAHRLSMHCTDVKRTTGQHPGGIIVVPLDKDVYDFTPIQYPADETDASWKTTHYKFAAIHDEILKLDLLGHVDPSALRMLQDLTGVDPEEIPMNDPAVLSLFTSSEALGVTKDQIEENNGSAGIPEFGTTFVKSILEDAKPTTFSELVQISGISHGTDVWRGNAQDLIRNHTCRLMETIGCRDDIMTYLIHMGLSDKSAFKIMESVRKGKGLSEEFKQVMRANKVPEWYIESCQKIKYMFPKAHAVAYVVMALRVAWFKVYRPLEYYATYFTTRCNVYELETMVQGQEAIRTRLFNIREKIRTKSPDLDNRERELEDVLLLALEMTARGYRFAPLSLAKSHATQFLVDGEHGALIPPFISIPGLGESQAQSIVLAREDKPFLSKQDLLSRTALNATLVKTFEKMGVLKTLQEEDQLSFSFF